MGGSKSAAPNHLKYLTIWNFEGHVKQSALKFYEIGEWTAKIVEPILSGFVPTNGGISADSSITMANESYGTHVDEESLYEEQLKFRFSNTLPSWVNEAKNNTLKVSPNSIKTYIGNTIQLSSSLLDDSSHSKTWSSSDTSIASVSNSGLVTANDNGSATITVTSNGITASSAVTIEPIMLSIAPSAPSITQTKPSTLSVKLNIPGETISNITWTSNDPSIAAIDTNGIVTGYKTGTTTINASGEVNGNTYTTTTPITINALPDEYTETFENMENYGWHDGVSFEGDNNLEWLIDGKIHKSTHLGAPEQNLIYHGTGNTLVESTNGIFGGIGNFEVTCKNVWGDTSNDRKLELFINGISKGVHTANGDGTYTFSISDINVAG
jgi:hypothetical protein